VALFDECNRLVPPQLANNAQINPKVPQRKSSETKKKKRNIPS
jgi:hypothetical protein